MAGCGSAPSHHRTGRRAREDRREGEVPLPPGLGAYAACGTALVAYGSGMAEQLLNETVAVREEAASPARVLVADDHKHVLEALRLLLKTQVFVAKLTDTRDEN